jgi:hypothetical protein
MKFYQETPPWLLWNKLFHISIGIVGSCYVVKISENSAFKYVDRTGNDAQGHGGVDPCLWQVPVL